MTRVKDLGKGETMLIDELLKAIQVDRDRAIAEAERARLVTAAEPPEPEPWTWLRTGPAGGDRKRPVEQVRSQPGRPATDPTM
ncbi:MAG TPA: hypothetical protein VFO78_03715 [Candidatus Limnocylindrales bacterium]|nr:hypothetical protein [Candidatus Limnocylindrales bacterium]